MQQVKNIAILVLTVCLSGMVLAQNRSMMGLQFAPKLNASDNLAAITYLSRDTIGSKKKFQSDFKLLFSFDSRNSFVLNQQAKMAGLRLGLEMFDRYRMGFGFYALREPVALPNNIRREDTLKQALRFNYSTIFFEYVLYEDFKWEASAAVPFGLGKGIVDTISSLTGLAGERVAGTVYVVAPSIGGHYKLFYWLGVGSGVGYRFVAAPERNVRRSLSAPFYVIKVKLFLGGIYKTIFKHEEVKAERAAWRNEKRERKERRRERRQNKKSNDTTGSQE